ncbi:MAG: hypothetical protein K9L28_10190 [Synergistales bacterium]|nr:hypothetical protein [Synergistales bacterium]
MWAVIIQLVLPLFILLIAGVYIRAAVPFVVCMLAMITLLTFFPDIALFLPSLLFD